MNGLPAASIADLGVVPGLLFRCALASSFLENFQISMEVSA
jgi:hypothetical protein